MKFLRQGNLVYIAIRKNASTLYTNFLQLQLGWSEINFQDVEWGKDIVFSHISEPMSRHIKGVAEAITQNSIISDIFNDSKFCNILGHSIVDSHCVPLYTTLGEYAKNIDWILLDSEVPSETLTSKFLTKHNIDHKLVYEQFRFRNSKSDVNHDVRTKIKNLIDLNKDDDTLTLLYHQDKILYNQVKHKFDKFISDSISKYGSFILNPTDSKNAWAKISWDDISWLRDE